MNSMSLIGTPVRRLISNGYLKNNLMRQRKSYFSSKNGPKSNEAKEQINSKTNQVNGAKSSINGKIAIAGVAIGSLMSGYLLINNFRETKIPHKENDEDKKNPKLIDDLPEEIEYLIIGGGTAAFHALRSIRANQALSKVIVINQEDSYPYMKPPLSKELWFAEPELKRELKFKQWNDKERSIYFVHKEFYYNLQQLKESKTGGVTVLKGHKVVKINPYDQFVILDNGQILKYGKCLIANGSVAIKSDLEKNANDQVKKRILNFSTAEDFRRLDKLINENKSIALIGSEFLASELACALSKKTKSEIVQIMETKGNLSTILPEYLGEWTSKCLQNEGVKQITSTQIKSTDFKDDKVILNLTNGETLKTDYIIVDSGAEPNTDLAKTGNLEICPLTGGILANAELQVRTNLWVAGDVASFYDEKLGRRRLPYHDNALITGRLAGDNMSGDHKTYWHQPIIWSDLGPKIGFEGIGIIDSKLPTVAVFTKPEKYDPIIESKKTDKEKDIAIRLPNKTDDFNRGVVFYIREGIVVGILLWNVFDKTHLARRIINENRSYEDLDELAKLFELHKIDDLEEDD